MSSSDKTIRVKKMPVIKEVLSRPNNGKPPAGPHKSYRIRDMSNGLLQKRKVTFVGVENKSLSRTSSMSSISLNRDPYLRSQTAPPRNYNEDLEAERAILMKNIIVRPRSVSPSVGMNGPIVETAYERSFRAVPTVVVPGYGQYGMAKIHLQMPDIIRPGLTKTLALSYSTSAVQHNMRLVEDAGKHSQRKVRAQNELVRRIEHRLSNLKRNKEAFFKAKMDEIMKKIEEDERADVLISADVKKKKSEDYMTKAERKVVRNDRIKTRTALMHYRTANFLRELDEDHIETMKEQVQYCRSKISDSATDRLQRRLSNEISNGAEGHSSSETKRSLMLRPSTSSSSDAAQEQPVQSETHKRRMLVRRMSRDGFDKELLRRLSKLSIKDN